MATMDSKYERFQVPVRQNRFISAVFVMQTQTQQQGKGEMMRRNATQDSGTGNALAECVVLLSIRPAATQDIGNDVFCCS